MREFTFSHWERLRKARDFDRVYSNGRRIAISSLILIFDGSPLEITRLGVSVGKKIGKAVVRNRVKRLLREAFRLNKHKLKKGYDILLIARKGIEDLKFQQVEAQVLELFRRSGLLFRAGEDRPEDIPVAREG